MSNSFNLSNLKKTIKALKNVDKVMPLAIESFLIKEGAKVAEGAERNSPDAIMTVGNATVSDNGNFNLDPSMAIRNNWAYGENISEENIGVNQFNTVINPSSTYVGIEKDGDMYSIQVGNRMAHSIFWELGARPSIGIGMQNGMSPHNMLYNAMRDYDRHKNEDFNLIFEDTFSKVVKNV